MWFMWIAYILVYLACWPERLVNVKFRRQSHFRCTDEMFAEWSRVRQLQLHLAWNDLSR